ncbi:MAG: VOC family protein [Proteobacteria bacterium]|nr:VOC family protein [Pseudomonadota bacterium]MDA1298949.1 VOC family protein [Pseudomonadota bacterium]
MATYRPHHIHLMSHEAMSAAAFYERMFGARVVSSKGANGLPRANITLGDQFILISTVDERVTRTATGPHSCLGLDHLGLAVDDLAAAVSELKAKGAEFLMEPNGHIAFVKGPDEVSIELVQTA